MAILHVDLGVYAQHLVLGLRGINRLARPNGIPPIKHHQHEGGHDEQIAARGDFLDD